MRDGSGSFGISRGRETMPSLPQMRSVLHLSYYSHYFGWLVVTCHMGLRQGATQPSYFLPLYRTIKIQPLTTNTSYWVHMVCRDKDGGLHASHTVNFTTGTQKTWHSNIINIIFKGIHTMLKCSNHHIYRLCIHMYSSSAMVEYSNYHIYRHTCNG